MISHNFKKIGVVIIIIGIIGYAVLFFLQQKEWLRFSIWASVFGLQLFIMSKEKNEEDNPSIVADKYRTFFTTTHIAILTYFTIKLIEYILYGIAKDASDGWLTIIAMILVSFLLQFRRKNR